MSRKGEDESGIDVALPAKINAAPRSRSSAELNEPLSSQEKRLTIVYLGVIFDTR